MGGSVRHGRLERKRRTNFAMVLLAMFRRHHSKRKDDDPSTGAVDGGEGRGIPLGGHDERPPTGYRNDDDALDDRDYGWDDGDPADRRRDPLRK